jgi:FkbM family methyltransferase
LGAASIFYHDVAGRGFEFSLRRFLDLNLTSDDVFIDVGAHFGIHALTAATILRKQVSVLAIEPHPDNFAVLKGCVELNQLESDVSTIQKAIGDFEGVMPMWSSGSSMGHSLRTDSHEADSCAFDVPVTTLDRVMYDHPQFRWRRIILKIDVEGCEPEVLSGARHLFAAGHVAAVMWEKAAFHYRTVQDGRDAAVFDFLDAHRFEHFHMDEGDLGGQLVPLADRGVLGNIFSLAPSFKRAERYG